MLADRIDGASAAGLKAAAQDIVRDEGLQQELTLLLQEGSGMLRRSAMGTAFRAAEIDRAVARQWGLFALEGIEDPDFITRLSAVRMAGLIAWPESLLPELCSRLMARAVDTEEGPFVRCWALTAWAEHGPPDDHAEIERLALEFAALGSGSMAARGRRILAGLKRRGTLKGTP